MNLQLQNKLPKITIFGIIKIKIKINKRKESSNLPLES